MLLNYAKEKQLTFVVGLDEVGWGSFAGPVVVGAVILPAGFESELIKDSKKLSKTQLRKAYDIITSQAIAYSVQAGSVKQINKYGVEEAKNIAIRKCLAEINEKIKPQHILMDGDRFTNESDTPHTCVPKGDNTYFSMAAAAIIAKVRRDDYMKKLHEVHPEYGWSGNVGYYSKGHGVAILEHGKTPYHRNKYVNTWLTNQEKKSLKTK